MTATLLELRALTLLSNISFLLSHSFTFSSYNLCHPHSHLYPSFSVGHHYVQDGEDIKLLGHSQWLFSFIFPNHVYPAANEKRTNELINFNCNVWVVLGVILPRYQTDMFHFLERQHYVDNNISAKYFHQDKVLHTWYLCGVSFCRKWAEVYSVNSRGVAWWLSVSLWFWFNQ